MKKPSQREMVLQHLQSYGFIEPLTALREYGCYRLGAVIFNLRAAGHRITATRAEAKSRITGRPVHYAVYHYAAAEQ